MNASDSTGQGVAPCLDQYRELGLIRGWRCHPSRAGHLLIDTCDGKTIETVSPRETELVCGALASAASTERAFGLVEVSAMFTSPYDLDCLVRAAGELAHGGTWADLSERHLDLARAARRFIELEVVAAWIRGSMADGYDEDRVNRVLGQLSDVTGVQLVCVWAVNDSSGTHAESQFYVEAGDRLYELKGNLWAWLSGDPADPSTPALPCDPHSWRGDATELVASALAYHDGWRNYALTDSSADD